MGLPLQQLRRAPKSVRLAVPKVRCQQESVTQRSSSRDTGRLVIPETTETSRSAYTFTQSGQLNNSEHRFAVNLEPDENAIERHLMDK